MALPRAEPVYPGLPPGLSLLELGRWLLDQEPDEVARLALAGERGTVDTFEAAMDAAQAAMPRTSVEPWRSDPASLAHHLTGGAYTLWSHTRFLSKKFVDAIEGRDIRQLWNLPSQLGKTSLLMRCAIWALDRDPAIRIMYVSYDSDKAVREAGEALDFARDHRDELRFDLRPDIQARGRWNTRQGGYLYATGVGGAITGIPAECVVGDDLIKGWVEAHSAHTCETTWNVYKSQMRLRLQSDTNAVILCGTRWGMDDPTGMALKEQGQDVQRWTLIRIPHIAEAPDATAEIPEMRLPDPLGREPGEPLEKFSLPEIKARERTLGPYLAAGLEAQRPAPLEGGELKRAWWKWETSFPPEYQSAISSWDMKLKDKEAGDYVVGQVWGSTGSDFWMEEMLRGQWGMGKTKLAIALLAVRHPYVNRHYIENSGNGPEVMEELRSGQVDFVVTAEYASDLGMTPTERDAVQALMRTGMTGLLPVNAKGDKAVRARAESGLLEGGSCHLRIGDTAAQYLVNEAATFPGKWDDAVDAWSQAMSKLRRGTATVQAAEGTVSGARASATPPMGRGLAGPPLGRFPRARIR